MNSRKNESDKLKTINYKEDEELLDLFSKNNIFIIRSINPFLQIFLSIFFLIFFEVIGSKLLEIIEIYYCNKLAISNNLTYSCNENLLNILRKNDSQFNQTYYNSNYSLVKNDKKTEILYDYIKKEIMTVNENISYPDYNFYYSLSRKIVFFEIIFISVKIACFIFLSILIKNSKLRQLIVSFMTYMINFVYFFIFIQYFKFISDLFVNNKNYQFNFNFFFGGTFILIQLMFGNNHKINFINYLISYTVNFLIGFDKTLDFFAKILEYFLVNGLIIIYFFISNKKKKTILHKLDEYKYQYNTIENLFNNFKDGIIILKKDGKINYNKKFLNIIENNYDENFFSTLKKLYFDKIENQNVHPQNEEYSEDFRIKDYIKNENLIKSEVFQIFIKFSIFNKIDIFNQNLLEELIDLIHNYQLEVFDLKNILKDELININKNKMSNNNKSNKKLEFSNLKNNQNQTSTNLKLISDINKDIKAINFNNENDNSNNQFFTISQENNKNFNILKKNQDENNKDFALNNNQILNTIHENVLENKCETMKNNIKNGINIDRTNNVSGKTSSFLEKSNKYFDHFLQKLRILFYLNIESNHVYIGERLIETESLSYNYHHELSYKSDINYGKNRLHSFKSNAILNQEGKYEMIKNVYSQKIFIRFNKIDESLEILFHNEETVKEEQNETIKSKPNSSFFEKIFSNILMKICHEIKNPILNIIELTKVFKEYYFSEEEEFDDNDKYSIVKDIKYISKSINYTVSDLEFLSDIIKNYDNPNEIVKKIKNKILKTQGVVNLYNEVKKLKKIFEKKIKLSKKEITINLSYDNLPQNIKLENSLLSTCIFNLLSNAIKFSSNGIINIYLKFVKEFNKLVIEISDQGIGIKKTNLNKLGHLFYKTENNNNMYGLGMGLFSVKMITEVMNGNLQIISEYGDGTRIILQFPLIEDNIISAYGKKNKGKIYTIVVNSSIYEKNILDINHNINFIDTNLKNYQTNSVSSYVNYLNSKYYSSCLLMSRNRKQQRLSSSGNLKTKKLTSFLQNKTKGSNKIFNRSKTVDMNYKKLKCKFKKIFTVKLSETNRRSSLNKVSSNQNESNHDNNYYKTNYNKFLKFSNQNLSNLSSRRISSSIRNSNLNKLPSLFPDSNCSQKDIILLKSDTNSTKKQSFENFNLNFLNNDLSFNQNHNIISLSNGLKDHDFPKIKS